MAYRWRIADFAVGQFLKAQAEIIAAPQTYVSSATLTIPKAPCNAREFSELQRGMHRIAWSVATALCGSVVLVIQ
jgi:hypothetical protein